MYLKPAADDDVLFGDVFAAEWLFDAWIEEDAERMGSFIARGNTTAYSARSARESDDHLLAHGRFPRTAVIVNDDCYIKTVLSRYQEGRLQFAPVFALSEETERREEELNTRAFGRFALPPAEHFPDGGLIDLRCAFGVAIKSRGAADALPSIRAFRLDQRMAIELEARWGAHSSRRGPVVALSTAQKLTDLLGGDEGSARSIAELMANTWSVEGSIADIVDEAAETGADPGQVVADLLELVNSLDTATTAAKRALSELTGDR